MSEKYAGWQKPVRMKYQFLYEFEENVVWQTYNADECFVFF